MFDIGGWEFLIIIIVAIVVIGPKELPAALKTITSWIRKGRELARDFQGSLDDLAEEVELEKITKEVKEEIGLNSLSNIEEDLKNSINKTVDQSGEIKGSIKKVKQNLDTELKAIKSSANLSFKNQTSSSSNPQELVPVKAKTKKHKNGD